MLTKAGKQALQVMAIHLYADGTSNSKPMFPTASIRNTSNQERWVSWVNGSLYSNWAPIVNNATTPGIQFGTSDVAPSEDDYVLKGPITSGITATAVTSERGVDGTGKPYNLLGYSVTNTSSTNNLTIKEIGIVTNSIRCCTSSTATSASSNNVLIDRTILDSPVTIEPRQTANIKYRLTCDMSFI